MPIPDPLFRHEKFSRKFIRIILNRIFTRRCKFISLLNKPQAAIELTFLLKLRIVTQFMSDSKPLTRERVVRVYCNNNGCISALPRDGTCNIGVRILKITNLNIQILSNTKRVNREHLRVLLTKLLCSLHSIQVSHDSSPFCVPLFSHTSATHASIIVRKRESQ